MASIVINAGGVTGNDSAPAPRRHRGIALQGLIAEYFDQGMRADNLGAFPTEDGSEQ